MFYFSLLVYFTVIWKQIYSGPIPLPIQKISAEQAERESQILSNKLPDNNYHEGFSDENYRFEQEKKWLIFALGQKNWLPLITERIKEVASERQKYLFLQNSTNLKDSSEDGNSEMGPQDASEITKEAEDHHKRRKRSVDQEEEEEYVNSPGISDDEMKKIIGPPPDTTENEEYEERIRRNLGKRSRIMRKTRVTRSNNEDDLNVQVLEGLYTDSSTLESASTTTIPTTTTTTTTMPTTTSTTMPTTTSTTPTTTTSTMPTTTATSTTPTTTTTTTTTTTIPTTSTGESSTGNQITSVKENALVYSGEHEGLKSAQWGDLGMECNGGEKHFCVYGTCLKVTTLESLLCKYVLNFLISLFI